jgi:protease-4
MAHESEAADQRSPDPRLAMQSGSNSTRTGLEGTLLAIVLEMGEQRRALQAEHAMAAAERKAERRWKMLFQGLFFGAPFLFGLLYFLFFLNSTGFRWGPLTDVIGIVRIEGEIGANKVASADNIIPALAKALSNAQVKGVVLAIDSPGGAPADAERIADALQSLRRKHDKPVYAVISNLGASAAYMIALRADKIVAGKYSLVGSIGAVMAPWQLDRAIARLDVSQRVYASGKLKSFLNPFTAVTPEADAKAKHLVDQLGSTFVTELKTVRGHTLKAGVDYGTGEIWSGVEAKDVGLVDSIGTLEEVVSLQWGLKAYDFGPLRQSAGLLSGLAARALSNAFESLVAPLQAPRVR